MNPDDPNPPPQPPKPVIPDPTPRLEEIIEEIAVKICKGCECPREDDDDDEPATTAKGKKK